MWHIYNPFLSISNSIYVNFKNLLYQYFNEMLRPEACLLNKSSCLAQALGLTIFINTRYMNLVTLCCANKVGLRCSTNPPQFVEQNIMLSCSFTCDQIYRNHSYEFDHTLLLKFDLDVQQTLDFGLICDQNYSLAAAFGVTKFKTIITLILVTLLCCLNIN